MHFLLIPVRRGTRGSSNNVVFSFCKSPTLHRHTKTSTRVCTGGSHNHCCVMMVCAIKLFLQMRYFVVHFWSKIWLFVCVHHQQQRLILFLNHRNRKGVGGKHNVLVHWRNVSAPNATSLDILLLISGQKSSVCVRASTAKRILFPSHRNRKVVVDTHNVLVHYVDDCAPNLSECWPLQLFHMRYFVVHFWSKSPTNHLHTTFAKINWYSLYLLLIFLYIRIRNKHTIPHYTVRYLYLHIPPGKLEHIIDSLSSPEHITCEWKASSSQPTIILDVIAVYPCFQKDLIKSNTYILI